MLVNFQFTLVGGCQQEVRPGQKVLWAFNAFNVTAFLDLSGPTAVKLGQNATFQVIDGESGDPVAGADVGGQVTDATGHVQLTFNAAGGNFIESIEGWHNSVKCIECLCQIIIKNKNLADLEFNTFLEIL